jgi:phenylpropionate dioxygenase-like ring-hydroxylating dioxygenase large terminal subunit
MLMHRHAPMRDLIAQVREGCSLPQTYYASDEIFAADFDALISRKWLVAGHVAQIPGKGDYFLFKVGGEQIIVVRENAESVRAFYNVCRHRGSTLCAAESGNARVLVCPYHAWSYGLDGALLSARLMPEDFDKAANGLHACHVREFHGFIFVNLSEDEPDDFDTTFGDFDPIMDYHGFSGAKVAHVGRYPTAANWKLVVENFLECYHCVPAHPEFCSMHPPEALLAVGAGPSSGPSEAVEKYAPVLEAWKEQAEALGRPVYTIDEGPETSHMRMMIQRSIREGFLTETQDGQPAACLMGKRKDWDMGRMHITFSPFSHVVADADFAMLFRFTPRSAMETDVDVIWFIDGKAEEVDVEKMTWGWHSTTLQDKAITEANQQGILSRRYQPGRYSTQERGLITFQQWYLRHLADA